MNDFISESLCGVRDATIDAVYNKFEGGIVPPPELWINMAVRFRNPAIVGLTNSVQRAIRSDRDEQGPMGPGRKPGPRGGAPRRWTCMRIITLMNQCFQKKTETK